MTHFSSALVTQQGYSGDAGNLGLIGYKNRLLETGFTLSADPLYPASNLTNPATAYYWRKEGVGQQTLVMQNNGEVIDYIGLARQNLFEKNCSLSIQFDGITVFSGVPTSSQAIMFLFNDAQPQEVRITFGQSDAGVIVGYLSIGKSLVLQRGLYVGHTPITYARDRVKINGLSENGQYLGEIQVRQSNQTAVALQNLTAAWYRTQLDPFFASGLPAFFAWRPKKYPDEISYCWVEGEPSVSNQRSNGMMQASFNLRGIA